MYFIEWMPRARKDLARLPKADADRIEDKIGALARGFRGGIVKLANSRSRYRLRVGVYRVLFAMVDNRAILPRNFDLPCQASQTFLPLRRAMKLHPKFIEKENRRFVVLPFEEYKFLEDRMHDYEDLRDLEEAIAEAEAKGEKSMPDEQFAPRAQVALRG